jgi:hypothetical protein
VDFKSEVKDLAATTAAETEELIAVTPEAAAAAQPEDVVLPPETADKRLTKYRELAVLDRRAAILLAFADVESAIRQRFRQLHPDERSGASFGRVVEVLHSDGLLEDEIADALRRMSKIRNQVAHEQTGLDLDVANYSWNRQAMCSYTCCCQISSGTTPAGELVRLALQAHNLEGCDCNRMR